MIITQNNFEHIRTSFFNKELQSVDSCYAAGANPGFVFAQKKFKGRGPGADRTAPGSRGEALMGVQGARAPRALRFGSFCDEIQAYITHCAKRLPLKRTF